jgi:hypothetical protein
MELPIDAVLSHYHLPPSTPETINPILESFETNNQRGVVALIGIIYPVLTLNEKMALSCFLKELVNPLDIYTFLSINDTIYRNNTHYTTNPLASGWEKLQLHPSISWIGVDVTSISNTPVFLNYYNQRLQEIELYRCGVNGLCQKDFDGVSLEECQATCELSRLIPDLYYKVLSYAPESSLQLPLNDQVRIVRDMIGYTIPLPRVTRALEALINGGWPRLVDVKELLPYLKTKYGVTEFYLRELTDHLNISARSVNYQALYQPFTELVRAYRVTKDFRRFRYELLSLFHATLELDVNTADVDLLVDGGDDPVIIVEKVNLSRVEDFIISSGENLLREVV